MGLTEALEDGLRELNAIGKRSSEYVAARVALVVEKFGIALSASLTPLVNIIAAEYPEKAAGLLARFEEISQKNLSIASSGASSSASSAAPASSVEAAVGAASSSASSGAAGAAAPSAKRARISSIIC